MLCLPIEPDFLQFVPFALDNCYRPAHWLLLLAGVTMAPRGKQYGWLLRHGKLLLNSYSNSYA